MVYDIQSFLNKYVLGELTNDSLNSFLQLDFWYPDAGHHVATNMTVDFQVSDKESQSIQSALDQNKMHYE